MRKRPSGAPRMSPLPSLTTRTAGLEQTGGHGDHVMGVPAAASAFGTLSVWLTVCRTQASRSTWSSTPGAVASSSSGTTRNSPVASFVKVSGTLVLPSAEARKESL